MSLHSEAARQNFLKGYNCSQAVVLAFAPELGIQESLLLRMVSGFGGGMGRLREVCGAVSAMFFVAGLLEGYDDPKDQAGKKALYARVQALAAAFQEKNGSIRCSALLGVDGKQPPAPEERTEGYYKKRPCPELVRSAAEILDAVYFTESSAE